MPISDSCFISVLDTSICSDNLGDEIIMDAVNKIVRDTFRESHIIRLPTHEFISFLSHRILRKSDLSIFGGTNIGGSRNWRVNPWDCFFIKNLVFLGVGWGSYSIKPNVYWQYMYDKMLDKKRLHSVRDSYTKQQMSKMGITNVANTSCPTMWNLTPEHCSKIPQKKKDSVVLTFTSYSQSLAHDTKVVEILSKKYKTIYFFPQHPADGQYMKNICESRKITSVTYLPPSISGLDTSFSYDVDYIGTRLHAGIRALQHKVRTLILGVDNRAAEISKDTSITVIDRSEHDKIAQWIDSTSSTVIQIPEMAIQDWKSQFTAR
jgi:polysaccharide pyruvyl transferase WcaK-like protein